jgi:hypothetical protein
LPNRFFTARRLRRVVAVKEDPYRQANHPTHRHREQVGYAWCGPTQKDEALGMIVRPEMLHLSRELGRA